MGDQSARGQDNLLFFDGDTPMEDEKAYNLSKSCKRGAKRNGSQKPPIQRTNDTGEKQSAKQDKLIYDKHILPKTKQRMEKLVSRAILRSKETSEKIIEQEFQYWVEDTRFTQSRDTKVFRLMELY